jgi:DNA-binding MarR family transcriptional regulator
MDLEVTHSPADDLDALLDEMDSQVLLLGRLFSARQSGDGAAPHGHGQAAHDTLSTGQLALVRAVADGPMKMADIAVRLGVKPPAVSAMVDAAERTGYVTRDRDDEDRRVTRVGLTGAGRAALREADRERREMLRRHAAVLSRDDLRALIRIQNVLIDAMVAERL